MSMAAGSDVRKTVMYSAAYKAVSECFEAASDMLMLLKKPML